VIEGIDGREVDVERMKAIELATCSTSEQVKVLEELDDRTNRSLLYVEEGERLCSCKNGSCAERRQAFEKQAAVNFVESL
jgi:hypothetical protein